MAENKELLLRKALVSKSCGNNLFERKEYEKAIVLYRKAIEICPKGEKNEIAIFHQNIAACYEKLKFLPQVIEECTRALSLNPKYVKALKRRANALELTENLNEAINDIAALCVLQGATAEESIKKYGNLLERICEKETKEWMQNRVEVDVSDEVIRIHFSNFINNGFIEGEVNNNVLNNTLSKLQSDVNDADRCHKIDAIQGTFEYLKTNYSEADEFFAKIVQSDCNKYLKVYSNIMLAITCFRPFLKSREMEMLRLLPKSYERFDAAIKVDAGNADIYFHRAVVHYIVRKFEKAIDDLNKYIELTGKKNGLPGNCYFLTSPV
ncbi:Mitochondrial import receptor subunit TOM70-like protein [Leptotrombidium deliense]|uniref:Mitochondrial import receptor subunit TOM70-like protein n=1 Tax=Leptotrombidium deliense TaxID=299467 RepID=A0A443S521_9ACAR|nr:Mitochondrial import receptor subunit TOM70-like protein [Leptotrombidium deliense]